MGVGGEQVRGDVGVVRRAADGDPGHLDRTSDAGGQVVGLLGDEPQHLAADGAAAQQRDLQRLRHGRAPTGCSGAGCDGAGDGASTPASTASRANTSDSVCRRTISVAAPSFTATTGGLSR